MKIIEFIQKAGETIKKISSVVAWIGDSISRFPVEDFREKITKSNKGIEE
jgi:hypothetical protein